MNRERRNDKIFELIRQRKNAEEIFTELGPTPDNSLTHKPKRKKNVLEKREK